MLLPDHLGECTWSQAIGKRGRLSWNGGLGGVGGEKIGHIVNIGDR
jgi:hypothetical protein